jgi:hypothetical protein
MSDLTIDRSSFDKPSPKELKTGFEEAGAGLAG